MIGAITRSRTDWKASKNSQFDGAIEQAKHTDMVALVGKYAVLRKKSAGEYEGPCPKCGGENRFSVGRRGWFCRQCHPLEESKHGWYGPIDFIMWINGVGFKEAVAFLTGVQMTYPEMKAEPAPPKPTAQTDDWRKAADRIATAAQAALWEGGNAGEAYLESRGIEPFVWMAFGMGFAQHKERPAIVLPWYRGGKLTAIRYRYLVTPDDGNKIVSQFGSIFAGALYGGQALNSGKTLLVCEGELNAASIWQVANLAGVEVLSVGSESTAITEQMRAMAAKYRHVIVWMDKREVADRIKRDLGATVAFNSPTMDGKEADANDMLRMGRLGYAITTLRAKACATQDDRALLLDEITQAARGWQGVDEGTAEVAKKLGNVNWTADEGGRWHA